MCFSDYGNPLSGNMDKYSSSVGKVQYVSVCVCWCVCVSVCICECMYVHLCMHVNMYVCVRACLCLCLYWCECGGGVYVRMCAHLCLLVCVDVRTYVGVCVCVSNFFNCAYVTRSAKTILIHSFCINFQEILIECTLLLLHYYAVTPGTYIV